MITTKEIQIAKVSNLTSSYIEDELNKLNIVPLRWAIVKSLDESFVLSVSYEI